MLGMRRTFFVLCEGQESMGTSRQADQDGSDLPTASAKPKPGTCWQPSQLGTSQLRSVLSKHIGLAH